MNKKIILMLKSIMIGVCVCLSVVISYGFKSVTFYSFLIIVLQLIAIYFIEFAKPKTQTLVINQDSNKEIDVTKLTIG